MPCRWFSPQQDFTIYNNRCRHLKASTHQLMRLLQLRNLHSESFALELTLCHHRHGNLHLSNKTSNNLVTQLSIQALQLLPLHPPRPLHSPRQTQVSLSLKPYSSGQLSIVSCSKRLLLRLASHLGIQANEVKCPQPSMKTQIILVLLRKKAK